MAVTASRSISIVYSGNVVGTQVFDAADNAVSPGMIQMLTLNTGANTIAVPLSGTLLPTAATLVPPSANAVQVTLKGVSGDTGILLHLTDPTSIALAPAQTTFVLLAASSLLGYRIFWS